jgi:hypothetical protein
MQHLHTCGAELAQFVSQQVFKAAWAGRKKCFGHEALRNEWKCHKRPQRITGLTLGRGGMRAL